MPAALALAADDVDLVADYVTMLERAGLRTGRSTVQAAKSFCAKLARAGGWSKWSELSRARQIDAIRKARAFTSWLLVTSQLTVTADILGRLDLRLGVAARNYRPAAHRWFVDVGERIGISRADIGLQWNTLAKITAITATPPDQVATTEFELARTAIIDAYVGRGLPSSGRNMASIFHRLQLTLFHAGRIDAHHRPMARPPVSVSGWTVVAPGLAEVARRYVAQVELSRVEPAPCDGETHRVRPARVRHLARRCTLRRGQLR
jgi:integrase/recombinase XerD